MIIWRGAIARTGGTVCSKVIHFLLKRQNIKFKEFDPYDIFRLHELSIENHEAAENQLASYSNCVWVGGLDAYYSPIMRLHPFRVVFVRRDLRASLASLYRLTKGNQKNYRAVLSSWISIYEGMESLPDSVCLKLSYQEDVLNIKRLTSRIASFIDIPCTEKDLEDASRQFDRNLVRESIERKGEKALAKIIMETPQTKNGKAIVLKITNPHDYRIIPVVISENLVSNPDAILQSVQNKSWLQNIELNIMIEDEPVYLTMNQDRLSYRFVVGDFHLNHISNTDDPDTWRKQIPKSQLQEWTLFCQDFLAKYNYEI